ncbi:MAG TPA: hypothetical protein VEH10_01570 [Thermoplasmata archaeon]|nr:hypothetical protein [Thermoplasmata archaeon]
MTGDEVLVVDETPSLGGSVVALLEAEGLAVRRFADLHGAESYHNGTGAAHAVVVVASNTHYCASAGRWALGPLRDADLVIVGTRDPALRSAGRLHVVRLPLDPQEFLELVRGLLRPPPAVPQLPG